MTNDDLVTTLVPDLDRDLLAVLEQLEELLMMLCSTGNPDDDIPDLPQPVADNTALDAIRALWAALKPTQHPAEGPHGGQLLGPDGRYEHVPLVPVDLRRTDLAVLAATARLLGSRHAASDIGEVLAEAAAIGPCRTPAALVEAVARLHGVLDLQLTPDALGLLPRLREATHTVVVLTHAEESAYQRTADRINTMWTGSGIDRWAY